MPIGGDSAADSGSVNLESAEVGLSGLSREQLQAELSRAQADLEDLYEVRHGFLGQTGVHIGMRVLKSARHQFERQEARLKQRTALLQKLLHGGDGDARSRA